MQIEYQRKDERGELIQIATGNFRVLKLIRIKAGKEFGGHYHLKSAEFFYVNKGVVLATIGGNCEVYEQGECFKVAVGLDHTIYAQVDTELIEVSTGRFDKDDIRKR